LENNHFVSDLAAPSANTGLPFSVGLFFSFRLFIMLLSVRVLGTEPQVGTAISLTLNFLLLIVVAFQSMGAADRTFGSMLKLPSVRWVLLFYSFSCCSLLWSATISLPAAAAYWCAMAADAGMVVLLFRLEPVAESIHSLMKGYVWGACAVAVIAWILPGQSDLRLGDDELLGANQIGYLCGFAFFFAQYLTQQKIARLGVPAALLGVTLLRSLSKTTIVGFVLAEGFLLIRDKAMSRKTKFFILLVTALVAIAFSSLLFSYIDIYSNAGNSPETLTGRLTIWAVMLDEAIKRPWVGYGFYSVWKVIPSFGEFEARHAHNEVIQQFYSYGAMGICMMAGLYGSFYRQIRRFTSGSLRTFYLSLLIFVLIRGIADTEVFDFSLPLWAIVMFSLLMERGHALKAVPPPAYLAPTVRIDRTIAASSTS